jgi:protein-glutamine gamma-glutamyltransferase
VPRTGVSRFALLHRGSALAVAALGFAALRIAGELQGPTALLAVAALLLSAWGGRPTMSNRVWVTLQVAFLAWLVFGWLVAGRHVLTTFAYLLIFVQAHRLLTRASSRDDLYSYFIAFGQLLLASVLTVDVAYFVVFVAFVVCLVWALMLTRLARAVEQDQARQHPGRPVPAAAWHRLAPLVRWPWLAAVAALALAVLVGTMVLFFALPRLQASFLTASLLPPVHVSGFSEQVRLGEIGMVQLSDEPVMRIRATDREGTPVSASALYWHGLAMDRFDGRTWSLSDPRKISLGWVGSSGADGPPSRQPWTLRQEITLEAIDSDVLFHVATATGIYGTFRELEAARTDGFYVPGLPVRRTYTVYSSPVGADPDRLRTLDPRDSDAALLERYTQLPASMSPRVAAITRGWVEGARTPLDEALLLQERFRTRFTYSLSQPAAASPDPLLAFLDEVQEGHCEYFATAMTAMLRTRGIPARVVNGFQGGEWNPVGGYHLVRQRDAHSWVEVHFPGLGWIVFDPTPVGAGGLRGRARIRMLARLAAWGDYGRVRWSELMLDYGLDNQAWGLQRALAFLSGDRSFSLVGLLLEGPRGATGRGSERRAGGSWAGPLVVLGVVALLLALLALARRRRGGAPELPRELRRASRQVARLDRCWARALRRAGQPPIPGATTLCRARRAAERVPELAEAPARIERYYASRFGGAPVDRDLELALRRLLRLTRRSRRAHWTSTGHSRSAE